MPRPAPREVLGRNKFEVWRCRPKRTGRAACHACLPAAQGLCGRGTCKGLTGWQPLSEPRPVPGSGAAVQELLVGV